MSALTKPATIFPSWHFSRWHAVDDRVRGGSSQSHLDPVPIDVGSAVGYDKPTGARFWGTLDTKTLGGAGFASQRYIFGPEPLDLPRLSYQGITLRLLPDEQKTASSSTSPAPINGKSHPEDPHTFTLVLKTSPPQHTPSKPKLPPNPEPASLSYEHDFSLSSPLRSSHTPETLHLSFDDFKAVYRGRDVPTSDPRYKPFDPTKIFELSLMCRSAFGKQEGEFGVVVVSMEGWGRAEKKEREGCWRGVQQWVGSWLGGERGVKL
ncbi:uncharacterized protein MKK02DRAFT_43725 [Dioszegia hungarica]|uniref:NADH:ubiquinone oxidoreductase intermediate-associated protein 30 domain-containing protein n=1 Tax=Dioszegia hungarica TaxID=4972 RepID=A0AA38H6M9_9TREE|nr:uncharacterized protein MKK02DRAFT_43725 [Dioszegia hungarica]KAI9635048.1 hypothetical protein MKK02DRAFT_43725 [Dioszegia hungarica]